MSEYSHDVTVTVTVTEEMIESIIEMAGYGIAYWASAAKWDAEARTYTVTEDSDEDAQPPRVLTYDDLSEALGVAAKQSGYAANALLHGDAGEIDALVGDVVVQIAMFDKVVYG